MNSIPFLTARWTDLAMLTYAVPASVLEGALPLGCELDTFEGEALVSLVAFDFSETRVFGFGWPGFRNFAEVNLRFYVRRGDRHGVCFLRELVGKRVVAGIARAFYNEPFRVAPVTSRIERTGDRRIVRRDVFLGGQMHHVQIDAGLSGAVPEQGSIEHFITEQEWGFGANRSGRLLSYQVQHPAWEIHPVRAFNLNWNWEMVYGKRWAFLQDREPRSVMLVAGSAVRLYPRAIVVADQRVVPEHKIMAESV